MEMLSKNRNSVVLGTVLLFLLLLLVFLFGIRPLTGTIEERGEELDRIQKQNGLIQGKINEIKSANPSEDLDAAILKAMLPGTDDSEQLLLDLSRIGKETRVELKNASFAKMESNRIHILAGSAEPLYPAIKELSVSTVVSGTYNEIREWMVELQEIRRLIVVDSFSFQQPYEFKEPGSLLTANITFTAYYIP